MKKSFVLYSDQLDVLDELSDDQVGQLFRAIKDYQNGNEVLLNPILRIAFTPFKNQFKRDFEKYEKVVEARRAAGSKGGQARAGKSKQLLPIAGKSEQAIANQADNDNVTETVTDNVTETVNKEHSQVASNSDGSVKQVFEYWCLVMGKSRTKLSDKRRKAIKSRLKDYSVDEIKLAIDNCSKSIWHMGQNNRNREFNDIELICRDEIKLEQFRDMVEFNSHGLSEAGFKTMQAGMEWANDI